MHRKWEVQTGDSLLTSYLADWKCMKSRIMSSVAWGKRDWLYFCHFAVGTNLDDSLTAFQAKAHCGRTAPPSVSVKGQKWTRPRLLKSENGRT